MSRLRADTLTDRTGTSAPDLTHGATSTTGTFSGDLGGGDVTLSGNATVDGTLTYQDADNINSTGIITAQQGIQVLANGFDVTGISTFNSPITVAGGIQVLSRIQFFCACFFTTDTLNPAN